MGHFRLIQTWQLKKNMAYPPKKNQDKDSSLHKGNVISSRMDTFET